MAVLSKFYNVTRQVMVEYIADQYLATEQANTVKVNYVCYTGKDNEFYYTDRQRGVTDLCSQDFIKFPDESASEYTFMGLQKNTDRYSNSNIFYDSLNDNIISGRSNADGVIQYDKIRIHLVYGFLLDSLAGFTLQVKTSAKYLTPIQKTYDNSKSHYIFDEKGNPVFQTETVNGTEYERLVSNFRDITLLDIFFPKEALNLHGMVKWHTVPIYQNGCFYDRYIEFNVPSAYYLSLDGSSIQLTTNNVYGYKSEGIVNINNNIYAVHTEKPEERTISYTVLPDPQLIINFATVAEENAKASEFKNNVYYASTFIQDPINQIALKYKSNSDFFNVKIFEDVENNEIVYYPVFGDGANARELDYDIFNEIETGAIPMITEGFYDSMSGVEEFYEQYGAGAYKWIIHNDMSVTYIYEKTINNLQSTELDQVKFTQHFTNIIDYNVEDPKNAGPFWRSTFIPKVPPRNNMYCKAILISYTCRLINRLTSVEAIRTATLCVNNPARYVSKRIAINNVVTYKIVNQIKNEQTQYKVEQTKGTDKMIVSYYDATNLVVKDMGNSNVYTQGQMTLQLKHTSSNYLFRLYTLNDDNVRIPLDLTGPYRYKLVFPTNDGNKVVIYPNTDNSELNFGIGQLVFYITEDQVKRIMNVSQSDRYFAIMTDTDNSDSMQSTLYEGKVSYYN